jgi:hypothetical protein
MPASIKPVIDTLRKQATPNKEMSFHSLMAQ